MVSLTSNNSKANTNKYRCICRCNCCERKRCCYVKCSSMTTQYVLSDISAKIVNSNTTFSILYFLRSTSILLFLSRTSSGSLPVTTASSSPTFSASSSLHLLRSRRDSISGMKPILLLDVDNTLYDDRIYHIEEQIIHNIHAFVNHTIKLYPNLFTNLSYDETSETDTAKSISNALHTQYGSTINGLSHLLMHGGSHDQATSDTILQAHELQKHFYDAVYNSIDYSSLLSLGHSNGLSFSTGYGHTVTTEQQLLPSSVTNQEQQYHHTSTTVAKNYEYPIRKLLHMASTVYNIQIASNSPLCHVQSIVQAMGLCTVFTNNNGVKIYTPDVQQQQQEAGRRSYDGVKNENILLYPTKLQPIDFFRNAPFLLPLSKKAMDRKDNNDDTLTTKMIDDSLIICQSITNTHNVNIDMIHLSYDNKSIQSFFHAVCAAMGWIRHHHRHHHHDDQQQQQHLDEENIVSSKELLEQEQPYSFDEVRYIYNKNIVDIQSIHVPTYHAMINNVIDSTILSNDCTSLRENITIVDIGAGTLFMLQLLLQGSSNNNLPSLLSKIQQLNDDKSNISTVQNILYYAYEPNLKLLEACQHRLLDMGFQAVDKTTNNIDDNESPHLLIYHRPSTKSTTPNIIVHVYFIDFRDIRPTLSYVLSNNDTCHTQLAQGWNPSSTPNLIIGCCLVDLFEDPNDFVSSILRCFMCRPKRKPNLQQSNSNKNSVLYFPITFTGTTSVYPSQPFMTAAKGSSEMYDQLPIPSDTLAFKYYAKVLKEVHHHNLDHFSIIRSVQDYGGIVLGQGVSNWVIHPNENKYLWETMLYFFGTVAAPEMQHNGYDAMSWLKRLRYHRPVIRANNVDLLFRLSQIGEWKFHQLEEGTQADVLDTSYEEILFTGPYEVTFTKKIHNSNGLLPNDVKIRSEYSLISSGTELKIFQGNFDRDALVDTTIKEYNDQRMAYPLSYGYSLVGRVIECGSSVVDAKELVGKLVFTFSAHASQVVTDRSSIFIVPTDIDAIDAIFMPSVETALSLVQDARPIIGENIAVYGQGLIGLLVTAVLQNYLKGDIVESSFGEFGSVTAFDTNPDRLAASASMGASQSLAPATMKGAGPFDVTIEVSGRGEALQVAIDSTRNGGRVIIGSWYGRDEISLSLGLDFHRSHKTIKTSQVSEIAAELSKVWTKERRFALTWAFVKYIRPSRLITLRTTPENVQTAYSSLMNGTEIAVVFDYSGSKRQNTSTSIHQHDNKKLLHVD